MWEQEGTSGSTKLEPAPAVHNFWSTPKWGIVASLAQTGFFKLEEIIHFFFSPKITEFEYIIRKEYIFVFHLTASNDCGVIIKHFINNNVTFSDCASD